MTNKLIHNIDEGVIVLGQPCPIAHAHQISRSSAKRKQLVY